MARPIQNQSGNREPASFRDRAMSEGEKRLQQFAHTAKELEHDIEQYMHATENYVRKNPVKSTILAGVVGLVLGKLLSK